MVCIRRIPGLTESGTLAAAAVQTNSTHSKRENKAGFEEASWHFAAEERTVRVDKSSHILHVGRFCSEVLLSQRNTVHV